MNKLFVIIIIISIILFVPVIPKDKPISDGVVVIAHECIYDWAIDQYHEIEARKVSSQKTE